MNISSEITINLLFNSGAVFGWFLDELNLIIVQNSNLQIPPMIAGDTITMVSAFLQRPRACLKNHSCNLHAPICGIFCLHSVDVARYAALIQAKSPTNCNAHLTESIFQTRSNGSKLKYGYRDFEWLEIFP